MSERNVESITTPPLIPALVETIIRVMQEHGGSVEQRGNKVIFTFPAGTTKEEELLRQIIERYWITFPDGYRIRLIHDTHHNIDSLKFPLHEFPEELQRNHLQSGGEAK